MNREMLDKSLRLIGFFNNSDAVALNDIIAPDIQLAKDYVEPFRRELVDNIMTKPTLQGKKDLIVFYIKELNRVLMYCHDYTILRNRKLNPINYADDHSATSERLGRGQVISFQLYGLLFDQIQIYCKLYKIPFLELCKSIPAFIDSIEIYRDWDDEDFFPVPEIENSYQLPALPAIKPTGTLILTNELLKHDFYNLKMVKDLTRTSVDTLVGFLRSNDLPYQIAMFDYLGFIKHVEKEFGHSKTGLYKNMADILSTTARSVKGNINVLNSYSKENKQRYTAHLFKEIVKDDYQKVK
ncbi:MAG: hypothetical protein Q8M08_04995 [Bacteroidales bacterium]|nr:hypothetical protein [Bacteroidales bacterium]